jgi:hypothetical protein
MNLHGATNDFLSKFLFFHFRMLFILFILSILSGKTFGQDEQDLQDKSYRLQKARPQPRMNLPGRREIHRVCPVPILCRIERNAELAASRTPHPNPRKKLLRAPMNPKCQYNLR